MDDIKKVSQEISTWNKLFARIEKLEQAVDELQIKFTDHLAGMANALFEHPIQPPAEQDNELDEDGVPYKKYPTKQEKLVHAWDCKSQDSPLCGIGDGAIAGQQKDVTCPKCISMLIPERGEPYEIIFCKKCGNDVQFHRMGCPDAGKLPAEQDKCKTCGDKLPHHRKGCVECDCGGYGELKDESVKIPCPKCQPRKSRLQLQVHRPLHMRI